MFQNPYMGGYAAPYYSPPMADNLAQLRAGQMNAPMGPMQQPQQMPAQQPQTSTGAIWVQGEEGAKGYLVAPGNSVLLMDSEASTFFIKTVDQSGMPMPLRIFDYTERAQSPKKPVTAQTVPQGDYVTREEFNALAARLDGLARQNSKGEVAANAESAL